MIYAAPGTSFLARVQGFPTGLTGTVGVQILDALGAVAVARITAGVTESPAASGSYIATLVAPATAGDYSVFWDDGVISPSTTAAEDLIVGGSLTETYITDADVKATLTLDGTTYADADVTRAVNAANASIDQLFGRKFRADVSPASRYYGIRRRHGGHVLEIDDLTRNTAITVAVDAAGDGTFATVLVEDTDYVLEPLNAELDGVPFEQIQMIRSFLPRGARRVEVTGTFGWPGAPPAQIVAFAEVLAVKLVTRFREAPFGIVTAGADMGAAMRLARTDPDFPTLSAGLCRGALIA